MFEILPSGWALYAEAEYVLKNVDLSPPHIYLHSQCSVYAKKQLQSKDEIISIQERRIVSLIEANCTLRSGLQELRGLPKHRDSNSDLEEAKRMQTRVMQDIGVSVASTGREFHHCWAPQRDPVQGTIHHIHFIWRFYRFACMAFLKFERTS